MRAIYVFSIGITRLDDAFVLNVSCFSENMFDTPAVCR